MEQYIIKGGNPLVGEVEIGGAKNAALAILAAAIMTDETVTIECDVPEWYVESMKKILYLFPKTFLVVLLKKELIPIKSVLLE